MKLGNNKDKFGYYQIGDVKTYSKVEAIELSKIYNKFPQWVFNDLEFSAYNWQVEPVESLTELYARRAKQLRETYDYIVLFFSGGADSSNMVNAFVDNDIAFEEIATLDYWGVESDPNSYFHQEQFQVSYPRIQQLKDAGVNFKHRRIDLSEISKQVLKDDTYRINRAYYSNTFWGTNHFAKSFVRETTPDYQQLIESGKKVVFVWGSEKPRIFNENGRYCVKFADHTDTTVPTRTQIVNREWEYDEFFYWAPECADIVCKQGHIIKNFLSRYQIDCNYRDYRSNDLVNLPALESVFKDRAWASEYQAGFSYRRLIDALIYPDWSPLTFTLGKLKGVIYNPNDRCFLQHKEWSGHIDRLISHIKSLDPYWINDTNDLNAGLKSNISQPYFLN